MVATVVLHRNGCVTRERDNFFMTLKPGSRPRGQLGRPYQRSVNLDFVEAVLAKRFADRHGLAMGAGLRELIALGLVLDARMNGSDELAALLVKRAEQAGY